jgi:hypothetical protein
VDCLWKSIWKAQAADWTYGLLEPPAEQTTDSSRTLKVSTEYLSIWLKSMRIVDVRRGSRKFYGTVHSFISLPTLSGKAEFHTLTTPQNLKNIDSIKLDRVIVLNQRLLGPIPYRGGGVDIELGLFSINSGDLIASYLRMLEKMASVAGVSYVKTALPFVSLLNEGINLLLGSNEDTSLEIGLCTTLETPRTGNFVVIRAPNNEINLSNLKLDKNYGLIDSDGQPIRDYPYMVFCVESSLERDCWEPIPAISDAYKDLKMAFKQQTSA